MQIVLEFKTESRYPVNRESIKTAVLEILSSQGVADKCEIGISIGGDRKMRFLNKRYLNRDYTTDVLSFGLQSEDKINKRGTIDAPSGFISPPDGILHLGDIVISYPQAVKNAALKNIYVDQEINNLVQHGVLHLLGIHHEE